MKKNKTFILLFATICSISGFLLWLGNAKQESIDSEAPLHQEVDSKSPASSLLQPLPDQEYDDSQNEYLKQLTPESIRKMHYLQAKHPEADFSPETMLYFQKSEGDKYYDWKQPINFYGQCVDMQGEPLAGVQIQMTWTDLSAKGSSEYSTYSDANGYFSLQGETGKSLDIRMKKKGYYYSWERNQHAFEFAEPYEDIFLKPDPNNPIIFYFKEKGEPAELVKFKKRYRLEIDETPLGVDLPSGLPRRGDISKADIVVRLWRKPEGQPNKYDWGCVIEGAEGVGFFETEDEFMLLAPEGGYVHSLTYSQKEDDPDFTRQFKRDFYIHDKSENWYASVRMEVRPSYHDYAQLILDVTLNPNGSRNLEYDPDKDITKQYAR